MRRQCAWVLAGIRGCKKQKIRKPVLKRRSQNEEEFDCKLRCAFGSDGDWVSGQQRVWSDPNPDSAASADATFDGRELPGYLLLGSLSHPNGNSVSRLQERDSPHRGTFQQRYLVCHNVRGLARPVGPGRTARPVV